MMALQESIFLQGETVKKSKEYSFKCLSTQTCPNCLVRWVNLWVNSEYNVGLAPRLTVVIINLNLQNVDLHIRSYYWLITR